MDQRSTLPPHRPRSAVITVRTVQAALAVLALAVLALAVLASTAVARPAPGRDPAPARPVVVVTDTTLRPPGYTPTPAGPPCPAAEPQGVSR
jgi:hypothetical protein